MRQTSSLDKAQPQLSFTIDDFELHEKIGSGKFGKVYKAVHKGT